MNHLSQELQIALDAARKGAEEALKYFDKDIIAELKADKTPVTIADRETEKIIKAYILSQLPEAKFVAEETGGDPNEETFWVIDPIDGTRSFSRGVPTWCILIALYSSGEVILGVCYYPVLDTLFWAEKNHGAYCNGERISVSSVSALEKAYIGYGSIKYFDNKDMILDMISISASSRSPDATYAAGLVAKGSFDSQIDGYAQFWDAAPLKVIIEEAGGTMTNLRGEPWTKHDRGYIVSNGLIHDELLTITKKYYK